MSFLFSGRVRLSKCAKNFTLPKRKRYDKQFKIAAARVVLGGEMGAVDLVRELGIKDSTLRRWAQEHGRWATRA